PAGWEQARDNKYALGFTTPAPLNYVGTEPLSAPESRAMYDFTVSNDFLLTLSYHAQGEIIYWKYLDYEPQYSYEIAKRMEGKSGYVAELTPYAAGFAGYKDWFILQYNRPGYTIEVGKGKSPLPLEQFDKIYSDNTGIFITALVSAATLL
ncbi:MAG: gamma-D-glutamyl-meso-diaminopimelate peptidase, partial [Clostridia bacterium]|nr:gamma-D-glutamyl-meso-diaminopimelate peptidase [Clostridia bacterium]